MSELVRGTVIMPLAGLGGAMVQGLAAVNVALSATRPGAELQIVLSFCSAHHV